MVVLLEVSSTEGFVAFAGEVSQKMRAVEPTSTFTLDAVKATLVTG